MQNQNIILRLLRGLASLKITVTLLFLSVILVFLGTLAQARLDVNQAVQRYFRTIVAHIEPADLVPRSLAQETSHPNLNADLEDWQDQYEVKKIAHYKETVKDQDELHQILANKWNTRFWIPYPGGFLLGILLAINLLAAHGLKFKIQASGNKLAIGALLLALGTALCILVVISEQNATSSESTHYGHLWIGIEIALAALWTLAGWGLMTLPRERVIERFGVAAGGIIAFSLFLYLMYLSYHGESPVNDNSSRILWQLIKGGLASVVLLTGCVFLFNKRAGIVLLHSGVLLIMCNELVVFGLHTEWHMPINQHGINWTATNLNRRELVFESLPDPNQPNKFQVISVPMSSLNKSLNSSQPVRDAELPCDLLVMKFYDNARPVLADDDTNGEPTITMDTPNAGPQKMTMKKIPGSNGASSAGEVNNSAIWIKLLKKGTDEELGHYLLSSMDGNSQHEIFANRILHNANDVASCDIDGTHFDLIFRNTREYKPYSIYLKNVNGTNYLGSDTPRNYSSDITMYDSKGEILREKNISMNNPLRYNNETIYQANFTQSPIVLGSQSTGLQIVANQGWMIPYLGCMIVMIGMFYHFGNTLLRFLGRKIREKNNASKLGVLPVASPVGFPWRYACAATSVLLLASVMIYGMRPQHNGEGEMDLIDFGKLGVIFKGRFKPLDTVARNALNAISRYETVLDPDDPKEKKRLPAVRWLMDLAMKPERAATYRIFYIDNYDLAEQLGLERRKSHLYSDDELEGSGKDPHKTLRGVLAEQFKDVLKKQNASRMNPDEEENQKHEKPLTPLQRKSQELYFRWKIYDSLKASIVPEQDRTSIILQSGNFDPEKFADAILKDFNEMQQLSIETPQMVPYSIKDVFGPQMSELLLKRLEQSAIIERNKDIDSNLITPKGLFEQQMLPFSVAFNLEKIRSSELFSEKGYTPQKGVELFRQILLHYYNDETKEFNQSVHDYQTYLDQYPFSDSYHYDQSKLDLEHWFNSWSPFEWLRAFYIIAIVMALAGLLLSNTRAEAVMQSTTFWVIVTLLAFHSFALVMRIVISGRPPVTNLYSSALFIGWGCVVLSLILEWMTRINIGNLAATVAGFATILVSMGLYGDLKTWSETGGDTMGVMRAVLDTQFWLSTHVVCVSLGYSMTFLAGLFGLLYLILGLTGVWLDSKIGKELQRMLYGTLCFAIFFSFVGTVLGGLWADDSWGRFWGWDPKENGALIIVLWNALVLHACWDGMIKERGLAALSLMGSIVTSWSYFGVNELGIGLHSYGQTEGTLHALFWFASSHLILMCLGFVPKKFFWKNHENEKTIA